MFPWHQATINFVCYHFRVKSQSLYYPVVQTFDWDMFIFKYILIISGLWQLSFANLKLCSEQHNKPLKIEAFICLTNETGYSAPFPIDLHLEVYFMNILKDRWRFELDKRSSRVMGLLERSWTWHRRRVKHIFFF